MKKLGQINIDRIGDLIREQFEFSTTGKSTIIKETVPFTRQHDTEIAQLWSDIETNIKDRFPHGIRVKIPRRALLEWARLLYANELTVPIGEGEWLSFLDNTFNSALSSGADLLELGEFEKRQP